MPNDRQYMRMALSLARRGYGWTSPNPMVGALLVRGGRVLGRGWHRRAGEPHAEIEALRDAAERGNSARASTLYVTLEPCSTHGRTPPCTRAIIEAGVRKVVAGATDPNPRHRGAGFDELRRHGIVVVEGVLGEECLRLNQAFNHWIVHGTPLVTVKAAMTLDGKIATAGGESKWITGEKARRYAMKLRLGADAVLVGVNTVLADDPSLTYRQSGPAAGSRAAKERKPLRRIVLDSRARTPVDARLVSDTEAALTTVVVSGAAPMHRVARLRRTVAVWESPTRQGGPGERGIDVQWLLRKLGSEGITSLLVEGGGEVNASFLLSGLTQRVVFFYAPKILGGRTARPAVGGESVSSLDVSPQLREVVWRRAGEDWVLSARVADMAVA